MAKKHAVVEPPDATDPETADEAAPDRAGPQGITVRYMQTGNPRKDFHPRHRSAPMIDPASLVVDGMDPVLALPVQDSAKKVIRRVLAIDAAEMLSCDRMTGGASVYRLATDAEVASMVSREKAQKAKYDAAADAKARSRK